MGMLPASEIDALVSTYAVGNKSGWHYLLTIAKNKASRYVSLEDAEDVAQDAYLVLHKKLEEGVIIHNLAGFITEAAHWKSLDLLKKKDPLKLKKVPAKQKENEMEECDLLDSIADEKCILPGLESRIELAGLTDFLKRIKPPCPEILKKRHFEQRAHNEVAGMLAISEAGRHSAGIRRKSDRCNK